MELIKKTKTHKIYKKKSGRYAVKNEKNTFLHGTEKVEILLQEKLIKLTPPKAKEETPPSEAATETSAS